MPYNIGGSTVVGSVDFLKEQVESLPAPYLDFREFLERLFLPSAEYLAFVYNFWKTLYTYITPATAPEDWLDWMLKEWMGWVLIPEGYTLARKRRLLANLHAHYKRRGTVWRSSKTYATAAERLADPESGAGIELLLLEFGIHAQVTDSPLYPDGPDYYGGYGSEWPLRLRVVVQYLDPWQEGAESFVGDYYNGVYAYESPLVVTREFANALVEWSRTGGTLAHVEFETALPRPAAELELMLP